MRYVCAYCNKDLRPATSEKEGVSHGICPACYNHVKASLGVDLKDYLNMLDHPVFLVDDDVRILSANYKAWTLNNNKPLQSSINASVRSSSAKMQLNQKDAVNQYAAPDALSGVQLQ